MKRAKCKHQQELVEKLVEELTRKLERKHTGRIYTESLEMDIERSGKVEIKIYDSKFSIITKYNTMGAYASISVNIPSEDAEKIYNQIWDTEL